MKYIAKVEYWSTWDNITDRPCKHRTLYHKTFEFEFDNEAYWTPEKQAEDIALDHSSANIKERYTVHSVKKTLLTMLEVCDTVLANHRRTDEEKL